MLSSRCLRLTLGLLLLLLPATLRAQTPPASAPATQPTRHFFWKVTSKTTTVYLFGSMHFADENVYPLPAEVEAAFAQARFLAVELDVRKMDQAAATAIILDKGMYKKDDNLSLHLDAPTFEIFKEACTDVGIPFQALQQFRPWAASLTLTVMAVQKLGLDPALGIDKHFLDQAKTIPIRELETVDLQVKALSEFPEDVQIESLKAGLKEVKELKGYVEKLQAAWQAGDADALDKLVAMDQDEDPKLEPTRKILRKALIDDRNDAMTAKIAAYLAAKDPGFVVVGAAHLTGKTGILAQLAGKGFIVEQPTVTPRPKTPVRPSTSQPAATQKLEPA